MFKIYVFNQDKDVIYLNMKSCFDTQTMAEKCKVLYYEMIISMLLYKIRLLYFFQF